MRNGNYEVADKEKIGHAIARILKLKKRKDRYGYQTEWGTKTPLGIFETILRFGKEIQEGNISELESTLDIVLYNHKD